MAASRSRRACTRFPSASCRWEETIRRSIDRATVARSRSLSSRTAAMSTMTTATAPSAHHAQGTHHGRPKRGRRQPGSTARGR